MLAEARSVAALDLLLRRLRRITITILADVAFGALSHVFGTGKTLPPRSDSNTLPVLLFGVALPPFAVLGHIALRIAHEPEEVVCTLVDTACDRSTEDEFGDLLTTVHETVGLLALMIVLVLQSHSRAIFRRVHASDTAKVARTVVKVHAIIGRIHPGIHVRNLLTQQPTKEGSIAFLLAVRDDVPGGKVQRRGFAQFAHLHIRLVGRARVFLVQDEVFGAPQRHRWRLVVLRHVGRALEEVVVLEPLLLVPGVPPFDSLHGERHSLTHGRRHVRTAVDEATRDANV